MPPSTTELTHSGNTPETTDRGATSVLPAFVAALGLLIAGGLAHLWFLLNDCPLDLSGDEAHYWEWSRRLDWAYYSKGPLVAYIIAVGRFFFADWSMRTVGSEELAVRLPAILLAIGTGLGMFLLANRITTRPLLALSVVAITYTMPILVAGSMLMTIDAPLMFLWTFVALTLLQAFRSNRIGWWLLAGFLIGLGILAKYTMLLIFPTVGIMLLRERSMRHFITKVGPWLTTIIGLCGLLPIAYFNYLHNWVSFRHVAGQAGVSGGTSFNPAGILVFLGGQLGVVNAVWLAAMVVASFILWRTPKTADESHEPSEISFLLYLTFAPWIVFLLFSPLTKIQPNWPVIALPTGTVVLAIWLRRLMLSEARTTRVWAKTLLISGVSLGITMGVVAHKSSLLTPLYAYLAKDAAPWEVTPIAKYDPAARLRGWSELGIAVGTVLQDQLSSGKQPFIVTDDYQVASEIAHYCPGQPPVFCIQSALGGRRSQYDLWVNPIDNPGTFLDEPCIYIGKLHETLINGTPATDNRESLPAVMPDLQLVTTVEHKLGEHAVRVWPVYVCERFSGFSDTIRLGAGKY